LVFLDVFFGVFLGAGRAGFLAAFFAGFGVGFLAALAAGFPVAVLADAFAFGGFLVV
jgi:hypothetical protein